MINIQVLTICLSDLDNIKRYIFNPGRESLHLYVWIKDDMAYSRNNLEYLKENFEKEFSSVLTSKAVGVEAFKNKSVFPRDISRNLYSDDIKIIKK